MSDQSVTAVPALVRPFPFVAAILMTTAIYLCSIYANLSFAVTNSANYQYFPPFKRYTNANMNNHLGAEYFNIAQALVAGHGFANPFKEATGPTAWMPPVLPSLLAGILWVCDNDRDAVMAVVIFLQVNALIATGLLVLALTSQSTGRLGPGVVAALFVLALVSHFRLCFQFTHDCWLVLLAINFLVAGVCWFEPLKRWSKAVSWGLFGGLCALINPIVGAIWGVFSVLLGWRDRAWPRLAVAGLVAGIALVPWTVRNRLVFGQWIPVKSNLAYEFYQSQCLQPDGLIRRGTFAGHPYTSAGRERQLYKQLGELAFVQHKKEIFWQAVRADPGDFLDRVAQRFLGATIWYEPFDRASEAGRPWVLWSSRLTHPLPFLALLILLGTAFWKPLSGVQWAVLGVYALYLLPYIAASYYERYVVALLGVKVLLVIWAADRLLCLWPREAMVDVEDVVALEVAEPVGQGSAVPVSP